MLTYLLDTNIIIYIIKSRPLSLLEKFNNNEHRIAISTITLAELIYGAEKSTNVEKNLNIIDDLVSRLPVIDYDHHASQHYGQIKAKLAKQGQLIGENDIHIAATARSLGLIIVTNNEKEFQRVEGVRIENWVMNT